jgi:transposase InsO family protein
MRTARRKRFTYRSVLAGLSMPVASLPWLNGTNESFNGKFRDECLNMQWFKNRIDAKILIEHFRREFNETRPPVGSAYPELGIGPIGGMGPRALTPDE